MKLIKFTKLVTSYISTCRNLSGQISVIRHLIGLASLASLARRRRFIGCNCRVTVAGSSPREVEKKPRFCRFSSSAVEFLADSYKC